MSAIASAVALGAATPTPGVGPEELAGYWSILYRLAWFLGGFVVVLLPGWFVVEPAVARVVRVRNRNNPTIREAVGRYVRLLVVVVAAAVGAGLAGYGGFLGESALVIAAATLAVGVAARTVIGSLVSGLVLVADPEFNVGNYVEWPGGEGTIQSIAFRVTRVVTPDGELVTVPNTTLTGEAITRPFGRPRYRVVERIGVGYDADLATALDHLEAVAGGVDGVAAEPNPTARVEEFGADAVVLRVHYWIVDPDEQAVRDSRSAYARRAKGRLEAAGIDLSPPAQQEIEGEIAVREGA